MENKVLTQKYITNYTQKSRKFLREGMINYITHSTLSTNIYKYIYIYIKSQNLKQIQLDFNFNFNFVSRASFNF